MPLGIKGRFYANVPVLYLTGTFYAKNFSAYSLVCNQMCAHIKGRFYANLISEALLVGSYPLPLCGIYYIMGTFYAKNIVGVKSSLYEYIQSQGGAITLSQLLQIKL